MDGGIPAQIPMIQDYETKEIFIQDLQEYLKKNKKTELLMKLEFIHNYTIESDDMISELMTLTKAESINDFQEKYKKNYLC